ncbi:MAG: ATP-binding protein [Planctomycetes bacterium]|nr:ATP-binding protein [Planctomycetota bacterium]
MGEMQQEIRLTIVSHPKYLEPIRALIQEACGVLELEEEKTAEIMLAVQEALANVIRHCYKNSSDERIDLRLGFSEGMFEIRIDDYGTFQDPALMKGRKLEDVKPGGLGVHFMRQVMDEVRYERNDWGGRPSRC